MRRRHAMIVNVTPFRGPCADVGSAYETGFMRALGRPVFAFSNDARAFLDRVAACCGGAAPAPDRGHADPDGMAIEPFVLHDDLMLAGGIVSSAAVLIAALYRNPQVPVTGVTPAAHARWLWVCVTAPMSAR